MSGVRGRGRSIGTTSATRPGRGLITATTSDRNTASAMPWVTISVVAGFSVQIRSSSTFSRCRVMSSSAPNGSSSSITVGLTTRQRAIATRCRMPPDSCAGLAFSKPCSPTSSIRSSIRPGSGLIPATSSGSRMLLVTVRHGSSAASWKAMPSWWLRWISQRRHAVDQRGARRSASPARPGSAGSSTCRSRTGPSSDRNEFCGGAEVGVGQRRRPLAAQGERLGQALDVDPGRRPRLGRRVGGGERPAVVDGSSGIDRSGAASACRSTAWLGRRSCVSR